MRIKKTSETRALAGNIVNASSESQNSTYSCDYLNGTLLWENSSPTSNFASQDMNLSSSDYDFFEIIFKIDKSSNMMVSSGRLPKGTGAYLNIVTGASSGVISRFRQITYSADNKLVAGAGRQAIGSTAVADNNEMIIPVYVVGYNKLF